MPYRHHSHRGKLSTLVLSTFSLPLTSCCVVYQVFLVSLTSTVGVGADFTMSLWALQCKVCWIMSSYFSDGIKILASYPGHVGERLVFPLLHGLCIRLTQVTVMFDLYLDWTEKHFRTAETSLWFDVTHYWSMHLCDSFVTVVWWDSLYWAESRRWCGQKVTSSGRVLGQ